MQAYIIRNSMIERSVMHSEIAAKHCDDHNIKWNYAEGVTPFNVDGLMAGYGIKPMSVDKMFTPRHQSVCIARKGVQACFMSHYLMWVHCVDLNKPIIILEHDGLIIKDIPENLEFTDVLQFDRYRGTNPVTDNSVSINSYINSFKKIPGQWCQQPNQGPNGAIWCFTGAYAYAIKPHAAQKLIDATGNDGCLPADDMINTNYLTLEYTMPALARLDKTYDEEHSLTASDNIWNNIK